MVLTQLRVLDLSHTFVDDLVMDQLIRQFNPTTLTLEGSRMTSVGFGRMITAFIRLKTLNLRYFGRAYWGKVFSYRDEKKLNGIEHLGLTGTTLENMYSVAIPTLNQSS